MSILYPRAPLSYLPFLLVLSWMAGPVSVQAATAPESYALAKASFRADVAVEHGLDDAWLERVLDEAAYDPDVIAAITRPYEAKPWRDYRRLFVTPARIRGGIGYWNAHAALLRRAEDRFGVPAEVVVAILGVETQYGSFLGRHRVIDALTTLGFTYPPRADFFRDELEAFLLLAKEESIEIVEAQGSYAGALGQPQFIPSSYRAYAIDFDEDGRRDLWGSHADVIGSVAHYLARHGWRRGKAIAVALSRIPATLPPQLQLAEKAPARPSVPVETLRAAGFRWSGPRGREGAMATVVRLDGLEEEYWLGYENFYVLTRYNHSNLYAMAVYQLAQAIRTGRERG